MNLPKISASLIPGLLRHAAHLVEDETWTTGCRARDEYGTPCSPTSRLAARWCAEGYLLRALWHLRMPHPNFYDVLDVLAVVGGYGKPCDLFRWNDAPDRTAEQVAALFRQAADQIQSPGFAGLVHEDAPTYQPEPWEAPSPLAERVIREALAESHKLGWCQGENGLDADGQLCNPAGDRATECCLEGFLIRGAGGLHAGLRADGYSAANHYLRENGPSFAKSHGLWRWNDEPERTVEDVRQLLEFALVGPPGYLPSAVHEGAPAYVGDNPVRAVVGRMHTLAVQHGWTQHASARRPGGEPTSVDDPRATAFCIEGLLNRALVDLGLIRTEGVFLACARAVSAADPAVAAASAAEGSGASSPALFPWNDAPGRTRDDVLALLAAAAYNVGSQARVAP